MKVASILSALTVVKYTGVRLKTRKKIKQELVHYFCLHVLCNRMMKHAFCLRFVFSLTMEYNVARKAAIITLILHMP